MHPTTVFGLLAISVPFISAVPHPAGAGTKFAELERRGNTDTYGDYTGETSQYADGGGKYIKSGDVTNYRDGTQPQKCWTDVVS